MIDKSDIKQWLDLRNLTINHQGQDIYLDDNEGLSVMMEDCFNDLSDQWVSAGNGDNIVDNQLCWVLMPSGEVMIMRFNNYIKFGGLENYWQSLCGDDYSLEGTKYIEIKKPEPPK